MSEQSALFYLRAKDGTLYKRVRVILETFPNGVEYFRFQETSDKYFLRDVFIPVEQILNAKIEFGMHK